MELGYKLKSLRENRRCSQQEIADYLNISQKTYSNYESCKSMPSLVHLCQLCEILEFDILEYLGELGVKFNAASDFPHKEEMIKTTSTIHTKNYELLLQSKDDIIQLLKEKITWLESKLP